MPDRRILWRRLLQTCRLMVGVPDYETYVVHRRRHHPDEPTMSYEEFFKESQRRRYGGADGGTIRCC
jgi:uncharacterized short protein YbdD (DUF466 family)